MQPTLTDFEQYLRQQYPPGTSKINLGSTYHHPVGPKGVEVLLKYLTWGIEQLNISLHKVGDEGFKELMRHQSEEQTAWKGLLQIASIKNMMTSEALSGIEQVKWENIESITLNENKIDQIGITKLVQASFPNLKKLYLSQNCISVQGCEMLSLSNWPKLQRIDLNYNLIGNAGLSYLILADWPLLLELNMSNNKLDSDGMLYLQQADWPHLEILHMSRNHIGVVSDSIFTDLGCMRIGQVKSRKIKNLSMFGNELSLNGLKMIFKSGRLVKGCFLELMKNNFTWAELRPLLAQYDLFCNQFMD